MGSLSVNTNNNTINTNNNNTDMLETSIDPNEWFKEVKRVKEKLKMPKMPLLSST